MSTDVEIIGGRREYDGWLGFKRRYIYPFRWFYQAHIWGFGSRLRSVRMFAGAVWHWDSCDYAPTLEMMEIAFKEISRAHTEHGNLVSSDRTAKQTRVVAELCRRLREEDQYDLARNEFNHGEGRRWAEHVGYLAKQDADYLGRMFRFVQHWWN
jgi:hypothetical protein